MSGYDFFGSNVGRPSIVIDFKLFAPEIRECSIHLKVNFSVPRSKSCNQIDKTAAFSFLVDLSSPNGKECKYVSLLFTNIQ